jgi:hypothetical protein
MKVPKTTGIISAMSGSWAGDPVYKRVQNKPDNGDRNK